MKTISIALDGHVALPSTTLATLWKITRRDGEVFGFTDHDSNIRFQGLLYKAKTGFESSEIQTSGRLNVDNLDVETYFDDEAILEVDVVAGLWDKARIDVYRVNYRDLSQGAYQQRTGETGQFTYDGQRFTTELRGLMQYLANTIGDSYGANCPFVFGGPIDPVTHRGCGIDLDGSPSLRQAFTVSAVTDRRNITISGPAEADNYFRYGVLTFTTGANAGYSMEVMSSTSAGAIALQLQMPFEIEVGDGGTIVPGCDKTEAACIGFSNILNFGGFADIPGMDRMLNSGTE